MPGELDDKIDEVLLGSWNAASRVVERYEAVSEAMLEAIRNACDQKLSVVTEVLRNRFQNIVADSAHWQYASADAALGCTFNYSGPRGPAPFLYVTVGLVHTGMRPTVRVVSCLANPVAKYMAGGTRMAVKEKLGDVGPMDAVSGSVNDFAESTVPVVANELAWTHGTTARYDPVAQKVAREFEAHATKFGPLLLEMIQATSADSSSESMNGESSA